MTRRADKKHRRHKRSGMQMLLAAARRGAVVGAVALGATAILLLGRMAMHAPFLHIRHIHLTGDGSLEELAPVLSRAGICTGSSIVTAQVGRASALLLRHDPWIASASITRKLPDRIDIKVARRTPVAVAQMDRLYLIDSRGTIFTTLAEHDPRLPLITGLRRDDFYEPGAEAQELLKSALLLIQQLKSHGLLSPETGVAVDASLGLSIVNRHHDVTVRMGFGNFEKKASALKRIGQDLAARNLAASMIDLSCENRAYVSVGT